MRFCFIKYLIFLFAAGFLLVGCNKDDELTAVAKPIIEFDHPDGIYSVVVGEELTLAPGVINGEEAEYEWTIDGRVVGRERQWSHRWTQVGEYYLLLTVRNAGGVDREEVRIDVAAKLPPSISMPIDGDRLQLCKGSTYRFSPLIGNIAKGEDVEIVWRVDGVECSRDSEFVFEADEIGLFRVEIVVNGSGGSSNRSIEVEVLEQLPTMLSFVPLSLTYNAAFRSTIVGRPVALQLVAENVVEPIVWRVNGEATEAMGDLFLFSADVPGTYLVEASSAGVAVEMTVVVYERSPAASYADASAQPNVLEWMPAPGQFIGETSSVGGMTDDIATHAQACRWAETRLAANRFVSLGAWGGYIVMGLGGAIRNSGDGYDFAIMSNAIKNSNEPGIVWVMQDVNANGLPDDEWYELRGSDFDAPGVNRNYRATYYRPSGSSMAVQWSDNEGNYGTIDYIGGVHDQSFYYPAWVDTPSFTLYGRRLPARNSQDPVSGFWSNNPFEWGYVDNLGSDMLQGNTDSGLGQWVGFRISNAVLPDGRGVGLSHIDFIKVQTGVMARSGRLGELSTEVLGLRASSPIFVKNRVAYRGVDFALR